MMIMMMMMKGGYFTTLELLIEVDSLADGVHNGY